MALRSSPRVPAPGRAIRFLAFAVDQSDRLIDRFLATSASRLQQALVAQEAGRSTLLVGWRSDQPVGVATVEWDGPREPQVRQLFPDCAEIHSVEVEGATRSEGIGSQMLAVCEGMAVRRGVPCTGVAVALDNVHAYSLYLRSGYVEPVRIEYDDAASASTSEGRESPRMRFLVKTL